MEADETFESPIKIISAIRIVLQSENYLILILFTLPTLIIQHNSFRKFSSGKQLLHF